MKYLIFKLFNYILMRIEISESLWNILHICSMFIIIGIIQIKGRFWGMDIRYEWLG